MPEFLKKSSQIGDRFTVMSDLQNIKGRVSIQFLIQASFDILNWEIYCAELIAKNTHNVR